MNLVVSVFMHFFKLTLFAYKLILKVLGKALRTIDGAERRSPLPATASDEKQRHE